MDSACSICILLCRYSVQTEIEILVEENINIARAAARRWAWKFGDNDALSIALEGLHKAAINNNPTVGNFRAYAKTAIQRTFLNKLARAKALIRGGGVSHVSIDEPVSDGGTIRFADVIEDPNQSGAAIETGDGEEHSRIRSLMERLPEIDRDVISRRFGLRGGEPETFQEIGAAYGRHKSGGLRLVNCALKKLRRLHEVKPTKAEPRACIEPTKPSVIACRKVEYGPNSSGHSEFGLVRGMYSKGGNLEIAKRMVLEGNCNRDVRRATGMHMQTVAKLRRIIESEQGSPIMCACGSPATHRGWCSVRYAKSPKRQKFIGQWGKKPQTSRVRFIMSPA